MIKPKKKICDGCGESRFIWKNDKGKRYCKYCWSARSVNYEKRIKSQNKPIPLFSPKRKKENNIYSKKRKEFLLSNLMCQAHIIGLCTQHATDVHHKKGRGKYYLDESTWLAACRACHTWIENHPEEAKKLGYSESRI